MSAEGASLSLPLDPAHAVIEFRTFAVGIWPIDGSFTRFNGSLHYDAEVPNVCRVELTVEESDTAYAIGSPTGSSSSHSSSAS